MLVLHRLYLRRIFASDSKSELKENRNLNCYVYVDIKGRSNGIVLLCFLYPVYGWNSFLIYDKSPIGEIHPPSGFYYLLALAVYLYL